MKLMVIKAVETRGAKDVIVNPTQVETIDASDGMSRMTTASGREIYTETPLGDLYTMWMIALHPEMEIGYNAGLAAAKAQYEQPQTVAEDEEGQQCSQESN